MTDINPIPTTQPIVPPQTPPVSTPVPDWKNQLTRVKLTLMNIFNKFYSNKKIFWPVTIAFGLIIFLIVVGLIFGKRSGKAPIKLPTPTPFVQVTPQASASGDILTTSGEKLNNLKNQINNLDVKESRLQLPVLNFNIKF